MGFRDAVMSAILFAVVQAGVAGLDHESFDVRQASSVLLAKMGHIAEPSLRDVFRNSRDPEVTHRTGKLLDAMYVERLEKRMLDGPMPSVLTLPARFGTIRTWLYVCEARAFRSDDPGRGAMKHLAGLARAHLVWDYFDYRMDDTEAAKPDPWMVVPPRVGGQWNFDPDEPRDCDWEELTRDIARR